MDSLLLDRTRWDLVLDANRNIAVASVPYSTAQDVACMVRTFLGEVYYDTQKGLPYFQEILGTGVPLQFIKSSITAEALKQPRVRNPACYVSSLTDRHLEGQIIFTEADGTIQTVEF